MNLEELKQKLRTYNKDNIVISHHVKMQAFVREINIEEMKENIINPEKLVYAEKQEAKNQFFKK